MWHAAKLKTLKRHLAGPQLKHNLFKLPILRSRINRGEDSEWRFLVIDHTAYHFDDVKKIDYKKLATRRATQPRRFLFEFIF